MEIGLVYTPVPRSELSATASRFSRAFFETCARTYFAHLSSDQLANLWEVEKINHGLLYIASHLREHGFGVHYYAYGSDPSRPPRDGVAEVYKKLLADLPFLDLICFYSITCNYHLAERLALCLKSRRPQLVIGYGGPHATAVPEEVLDGPLFDCSQEGDRPPKCPFDFVGIGEGEETVLEIARCLSQNHTIDTVSGIALRRNSRAARTAQRERVNPVTFSIPSYNLAGLEMLPAARIFPNRGCPNSCTFCADPWRKEVTYVKLERLAEEVEALYTHHGTRYLYVGCEDFLCDEQRAVEIATAIFETRADMRWVAQCRAKPRISNKVLESIRGSGCIGLEFGVESASQRILDMAHKNITVEDAEKCFQAAKAHGLYTHAYWMVGLPGETQRTAQETQRLMLDWAECGLVDTWEYKTYIPYPGTPVYASPENYGVQILTRDYRLYQYWADPVVRLGDLGPDELRHIHEAGLAASSEVLESRLAGECNPVGMDIATIENMF